MAGRTRNLIILGAGVHSLEMMDIVERVNRVRKTWNLLGFISAEAKDVGKERGGLKIVGCPEDFAKFPDAEFVPDNEWPRHVPVPRERLTTLIDPTTFVSRAAVIGKGCVFYPHCFIGHKARIGDYVFSLAGSVVNHDDVIEDRVVIASAVTLAGHVHVEADCYLGQSATIRQYLKVGRGTMIGMGAVVVKDVEANSVMAGNPARKLRDRK
jgi:sugar O-acyltransferase (sialic acid O-acetyltransferase NeuD family)